MQYMLGVAPFPLTVTRIIIINLHLPLFEGSTPQVYDLIIATNSTSWLYWLVHRDLLSGLLYNWGGKTTSVNSVNSMESSYLDLPKGAE